MIYIMTFETQLFYGSTMQASSESINIVVQGFSTEFSMPSREQFLLLEMTVSLPEPDVMRAELKDVAVEADNDIDVCPSSSVNSILSKAPTRLCAAERGE